MWREGGREGSVTVKEKPFGEAARQWQWQPILQPVACALPGHSMAHYAHGQGGERGAAAKSASHDAPLSPFLSPPTPPPPSPHFFLRQMTRPSSLPPSLRLNPASPPTPTSRGRLTRTCACPRHTFCSRCVIRRMIPSTQRPPALCASHLEEHSS